MKLFEFIEDTVSREKRSLSLFCRVILVFLRLLSWVYGSIVWARNQAYFLGFFPRKKLPVPVISIGNILVGGAGKTPLVLFVADLLKRKGQRPAILTRGYRLGGCNKNGVAAVNNRTSPSEAGDEPVLLAKKLSEVPVLVGRDRYRSGSLGISEFRSNVFVMDDGFQHISLKRDLDIVVIDASRPLLQPLLPRGYLREPVGSLKRGDGFLLTRIDQTPKDRLEAVEGYLMAKYPGKKIFHGYYRPIGLFPYGAWRTGVLFSLKDDMVTGLQNLSEKNAGLFAGVASPSSVIKTLSGMGISVVKNLKLSDHQPITRQELIEFSRASEGEGAEILVTTEKDAVKLGEEIPQILPLYVLLIELRLLEGEEEFYVWLQRNCPILGGVE